MREHFLTRYGLFTITQCGSRSISLERHAMLGLPKSTNDESDVAVSMSSAISVRRSGSPAIVPLRRRNTFGSMLAKMTLLHQHPLHHRMCMTGNAFVVVQHAMSAVPVFPGSYAAGVVLERDVGDVAMSRCDTDQWRMYAFRSELRIIVYFAGGLERFEYVRKM